MIQSLSYERCRRPGCAFEVTGTAEEVQYEMELHVKYEHRVERWRALK